MALGTTRARGIGIAVAVVIAALVIAGTLFDWNLLRGFVAHQVSERTGRSFAINGNLEVHLFPPSVRADQLVLGNAPWGSRSDMARIQELEFHLRFWPLLLGHIVLPEITLVRPDIVLEVNEKGERNWEFQPTGPTHGRAGGGRAPVIGRLTIKDGQLRYRDPKVTTDLRMAMNTEARKGTSEPLIAIRGDGQFKGEAFSLQGQIGSLLALRHPDQPYPIDLRARAGQTSATARGTLLDPFYLTGVDIDLTLKGSDMGKLHQIIGLPIPTTPPYDLTGHLRHENRTWRLGNFRGKTGNTDLAGDFAVDLSGQLPMMRGDLTSRYLDMTDLAGFIGGTPQAGSREQKREAARRQRQPTLLPDTPFNLEKLNSVNADVRFRGEHIKTRFPLDHLTTHLYLENGVLTLKPLNFGIGDGDVSSDIKLNARDNPIHTQAEASVRNIKLARLIPATRLTQPAQGILGGRAKIVTKGNSLAQMASNADGELGIVSAGGKVSNLLLAFSKIDIPQVLKLLFGGDKDAPLNCAVADFNIENGLLKTQTFVVDAKDTRAVGTGTIDLDHEKLDMTIRSEPKSASILTTPSPVKVRGTFKQPDISVEKGPLVARAAAALGLGVIAGPIAALVPLASTGPGKNSPCTTLIQETRQDLKTPQPKK